MLIASPRSLWIPLKEAVALFFFSAISGIGLLGFAMSVVYLPVATALLLHYTFPVVTVLLSASITGDRPDRGDFAEVLIVALGVFCSVLTPQWKFDAGLSLSGTLWGILAVITVTGQTLWGRAAVTRGGAAGLAVLVYYHLFGAFWLLLYKAMTTGLGDIIALEGFDWALIAVLTFGTSIGGHGAYMSSMKYVSAFTASLGASIGIVCAVFITSFFVVHSWPTAPEILGCALIMSAIALAAWRGNRRLKNSASRI